MIRGLWTAASGMMAQQLNVDVISNNLANVNTTGFKRTRLDFQDMLYQTFKIAGATVSAGTQIPTGIQVGYGTRPIATQKIFSQGDFQQTENPLDIVIEGDGFFQILQPDGAIAYTRAGAFKQDGQGRIVSSDGFILNPEISLPQDSTSISVSTDGIIEVNIPGEIVPQRVGTIELAKFANPAGLESIGHNLYAPTAASGTALTGTPGISGFGSLMQGFL